MITHLALLYKRISLHHYYQDILISMLHHHKIHIRNTPHSNTPDQKYSSWSTQLSATIPYRQVPKHIE